MVEATDPLGVVQKLRLIEGGKSNQDGDMASEELRGLNGGGSPPNTPTMSDRLTRLEVTVEGMRHAQNLTLGAVVGRLVARYA